jgi:hypothetical protein
VKRPLLLAAAVASLSRCSAPSATSHESALLVDRGLETVTLAPSPLTGWYSDAAREGRVLVARDDALFCEGRSSMRIEVLRPPSAEEGAPSITQVVQIPSDAPREMELSVRLRGSAPGCVTLFAYVWDGDVARTVAQREVAVDASWTQSALRWIVPEDREQLGLFVYVPVDAGTRIWIDDARLTTVKG